MFEIPRVSRLSVTICTLNEEKNIKGVLDGVFRENPAEVIVVDASSGDSTAAIAESLGARVIVVERKGLAYQRKIAVDSCSSEFIALLDADHRPNQGALGSLLEELVRNDYAGIEAQIVSESNRGYFDWAMEQNFAISHNVPGQRRMIGTPCVYRSSVLKGVNFDPFFTGPSDDTDLCYRLTKAGFTLGVGSATISQVHRSTARATVKKFWWYGKGDAQFVWKHPERFASMFIHQLWNYPVKKSWLALRSGVSAAIPFLVLFGVTRNISMFWHLASMATLGPEDSRIYRT